MIGKTHIVEVLRLFLYQTMYLGPLYWIFQDSGHLYSRKLDITTGVFERFQQLKDLLTIYD